MTQVGTFWVATEDLRYFSCILLDFSMVQWYIFSFYIQIFWCPKVFDPKRSPLKVNQNGFLPRNSPTETKDDGNGHWMLGFPFVKKCDLPDGRSSWLGEGYWVGEHPNVFITFYYHFIDLKKWNGNKMHVHRDIFSQQQCHPKHFGGAIPWGQGTQGACPDLAM